MTQQIPDLTGLHANANAEVGSGLGVIVKPSAVASDPGAETLAASSRSGVLMTNSSSGSVTTGAATAGRVPAAACRRELLRQRLASTR